MHAARTNRTLTRLIEDALREALARGRGAPTRRSPKLPAFGDPAEQPMPAVDLDDSAALLELMERDLPLDKRGR